MNSTCVHHDAPSLSFFSFPLSSLSLLVAFPTPHSPRRRLRHSFTVVVVVAVTVLVWRGGMAQEREE